MRQLVNLPQPCDDYTPPCVVTPATEQSEIQYGEQGEPGFDGPPGSPGTNGLDAFTTTGSAFVMPVEDQLASVQVLDNRSFTVGQLIFIASVGYFELFSKSGTTQMSLRNLGGTSALPAGALIGSGLRVTSGGQPGPDTEANTPKRYAFIAHREEMGTDGGGCDIQLGAGPDAEGVATIPNLEKLSDPDNIVTISGINNQRFQLPIGLWNLRIRVPSYFSQEFQAYLLEKDEDNLCVGCGTKLAIGNGYAGRDADGADPQRHATIDALVSVTDPANKWFEIFVHQGSWSFGRTNPTRDRALGVASDFDDGAAVAVKEIFTLIEIAEK